MGLDISKKELDKKIRSIAQKTNPPSFRLDGIENRKQTFLSELRTFRKLYTNSEYHAQIVSNIITLCKSIPLQIFLLKIFSENYYNKLELQNKSTFIVILFNKIHSILLNSSYLSTEQRLDCVNFQRVLMILYSKTLT